VLAPLLCGAGAGPAAAPPPAAHTVVMEAVAFQPDVLRVRVGETVTWVNRDPFPHTATSPAFDSGPIPAGGAWTYTPRAAGVFPYVCTLHPTMKGTLRVE
jgi:plastocyanin